MVCSCCATGQCCNAGTCTTSNQGPCTSAGGTWVETATPCPILPACVFYGNISCSTGVNACTCTYLGGHAAATCNCTTLAASGERAGGCRWALCEDCQSGACVNTCAAPRQCCLSSLGSPTVACCLDSQTCVNYGSYKACANKCAAGQTYCRSASYVNSGSPGTWSCCTDSTHKCCGALGCKPKANPFTVNVAVNGWVATGVTLNGQSFTVSATGSLAGGTVQWAGSGSTATPQAGVVSPACGGCDSYSVTTSFPHMSLIGQVTASGPYFLVGASYSGTRTGEVGELYLRQNDTNVGDNSGNFTGTITVADPCPGVSSLSVDESVTIVTDSEIPQEPTTTGGPGTELKALLRYIGIVATPNCSCNARAATMDENEAREPGWCAANTDTILEWLKEQADARSLPFVKIAAKLLVKRAISNACKKLAQKDNSQ